MRLWLIIPASIAALLTVAMFVMAGWDRPPIGVEQTGYRGTAMIQVENPRESEMIAAMNQALEPATPLVVPEGGRTAGEAYENVQVLGHLPEVQFLRLMTAMTAWIAPGGAADCGYCHNLQNLASEELYTYRVSRRMLQMTMAINSEWDNHVRDTGVTCYTCHRGQPVPAAVWSFGGNDMPMAGGLTRGRAGQNIADADVGLTSLPNDPFTAYLYETETINVEPQTALPTGEWSDVSIQQTEQSYALMIHMSQSLGVTCTYCHNTRAFSNWDNATPARANAWYGIRMTQVVNDQYIQPLTPILPANRVGPQGDALKTNCTTCHQGQALPLNGVSMLADYPGLSGPGPADMQDPPTEDPAAEEPAEPAEEDGTAAAPAADGDADPMTQAAAE
jgi:photosynthetic reaction center cytochrome c subunit